MKKRKHQVEMYMIPCESLSETKEEWTVLTNLDKKGRDKGKGDVNASCHY